MELTNLFILNDIPELVRFVSQYSSNETDREKLAQKLLGIDRLNGEDNDDTVFNISKIEKQYDKESIPKTMLDAYLTSMSLMLDDGAEDIKED